VQKSDIYLDSKITTNHEEIRDWIENNGGKPKIIDNIDAESDSIGIRVDFNGIDNDIYLENNLKLGNNLAWSEFFDIFEKENLAFEYSIKFDKNNPALSYRFLNRKEQ
jgi:hypothetical protein